MRLPGSIGLRYPACGFMPLATPIDGCKLFPELFLPALPAVVYSRSRWFGTPIDLFFPDPKDEWIYTKYKSTFESNKKNLKRFYQLPLCLGTQGDKRKDQ
jgi:hypothetical protein